MKKKDRQKTRERADYIVLVDRIRDLMLSQFAASGPREAVDKWPSGQQASCCSAASALATSTRWPCPKLPDSAKTEFSRLAERTWRPDGAGSRQGRQGGVRLASCDTANHSGPRSHVAAANPNSGDGVQQPRGTRHGRDARGRIPSKTHSQTMIHRAA